jgi:aminoglycoside 3-N-acetyltransferase
MFAWVPQATKQRIKSRLKRWRRAYVRRCFSFTPADLRSLLKRLGVQPGDVILVHSSFDRFEAFAGTATEVIEAVKAAIAPGGTLLMPTIPFDGTAIEYVAQSPIFDVRKTPSRMGLITELFRRSPQVVRSLHPTHSVAAWGAKANEIIAGHHLANTPCGRQSPYGRLLDHDGKILLLGTGIAAMTFFHTVEEALESRMPFSPFTTEVFSLLSRDETGALVTTRTRLFEPTYSRARKLDRLGAVLKESHHWREGSVGNLRAILVKAGDVLKAAEELMEAGIYCYEL